jgi:hypothetical protein
MEAQYCLLIPFAADSCRSPTSQRASLVWVPCEETALTADNRKEDAWEASGPYWFLQLGQRASVVSIKACSNEHLSL